MRDDSNSMPSGYSCSVWSASAPKPWPSGTCSLRIRARFAFRWLLERARLFINREAGAICIYSGDRLVHYSAFTPRYWRFPFLAERDLQIGDTWTDPDHRGKGLASFAVRKIVKAKWEPGRGFWYVVGYDNLASIRVVEKLGFGLIGVGDWHKPLGIHLLGSYIRDDGEARQATVKQTL
jgi:RimJ/RimL family protein N-acetyltransferase